MKEAQKRAASNNQNQGNRGGQSGQGTSHQQTRINPNPQQNVRQGQ